MKQNLEKLKMVVFGFSELDIKIQMIEMHSINLENLLLKKEAEDAELEFRLKIHRHRNMDKIALDEMIDVFIENRTSTIEVKPTTLYNYGNKRIHLKSLLNIKLKDFNINNYDNWKKQMNETNISTRYKNDILKFLKSVLNFAMTWYDFNLKKVYNKMTKFSNAFDIPKEMMCFTYDQ